MSALVVERPGLLTTVQDRGRWGRQHLGIPVGGWMDHFSARLANRLVGNPDGEAVLEVTAIGPTLFVDGALTVAVAGAEFEVEVGPRTAVPPFVDVVSDGARIRFGHRLRGGRAYLAVAGGLDVPVTLGSRSTDLRAHFGGHAGRHLKTGDRLEVGPARTPGEVRPRSLASPDWLSCRILRLLPSPEDDRWSRAAGRALCSDSWIVSPESDRMGYRLIGSARLMDAPGSLSSHPVVTGAVQIPPGGIPILLMADRQTTGGYPVAGIVAAADLPIAAQLLPGDTCRFEPASLAAADVARRALERALDDMVGRVG